MIESPDFLGPDYKCIGGVGGLPVFVNFARKPYKWDVCVLSVEAKWIIQSLDFYRSRSDHIRGTQDYQIRGFIADLALTREEKHNLFLLVRLFASHLWNEKRFHPELLLFYKTLQKEFSSET